MDELDHFGWQSRLEKYLDEDRSSVRYIFSRLEDTCVTADQRRKHFPGGDRQREVERRDDTGNADGPAEAHRPLATQLAGHRVAEETAPLGCGVVRRVD